VGKIIKAKVVAVGMRAANSSVALADCLEKGYEIETVASDGQGTVQYVLVKREEDEEEYAWKS
jgi:hypothetical protein